MANSESTAVNALIEGLRRNKPLPVEPGADLFASPRSTAEPAPRVPPSMSPQVRGPGELPPLPRSRAPQASSLHRSLAAEPSAERAPVAPAPRTGAALHLPLPAPDTAPRDAMAPAMPAPRRAPAGTLPMPLRTRPPAVAPVAAPFDVAPVAPATEARRLEAAAADTWSEVTEIVDARLDDWRTVAVRRSAGRSLARQLVLPGLVALVVGVGGGAWIALARRDAAVASSSSRSLASDASRARPDGVAETIVRMRPRTDPASAGAPAVEPVREALAAGQPGESAGSRMTHDAPAEAAERQAPTSGAGPALAEVRVDSRPAGATVTLVDRGRQTFLGTTPLSTSVDGARDYDLVVALEGHQTAMVHLDPSSAARLDVTLAPLAAGDASSDPAAPSNAAASLDPVAPSGPAASSNAAAPSDAAGAPSGAAAPPADADGRASRRERRRRERERLRAAALATNAAAEPARSTGDTQAVASGAGTLMVSSKPPCELVIDGRPTGLTTPQRSISLSAGAHRVRFVNASAGVDKTVSVSIRPGRPTRLIEDLMPR